MKIGIIFYSISGHTEKAARMLAKAFIQAGHPAELVRLEVSGPANLNNENTDLRFIPSLHTYEALVLCTPVRGGAMPPPVAKFLNQMEPLTGRKTAAFLTHFFRLKWGADQVAELVQAGLEARGGIFEGWRDARWFITGPGKKLEIAVNGMVRLLVGEKPGD